MSINLGFCRVGVMRQRNENNVVTAKTLALKPSFGKPGDENGGMSGFRANFFHGSNSVVYLAKRAVQKVKTYFSLRALTNIRNTHNKGSEAEIARLDAKIKKNPQNQDLKDSKAGVMETRIKAAGDAVHQAHQKETTALEKVTSYENEVNSLKAEMSKKLDTLAKGLSVNGEEETALSSKIAGAASNQAESVDANKTQDKPKSLSQLARELHKAERHLKLAQHELKAAERRVKIETDTSDHWQSAADSIDNSGSYHAVSLTQGSSPSEVVIA